MGNRKWNWDGGESEVFSFVQQKREVCTGGGGAFNEAFFISSGDANCSNTLLFLLYSLHCSYYCRNL